MEHDLKIQSYVNEKLLRNYFNKLYKINRSILGEGFRKSLNIIGELADLNIKKVKSGKKVFDWTVPNEWNISEAYIITPDGKKIADFKKHNLHVVNYSQPINKTVTLDELKKNLHTIPSIPNAIPYITSYYKKDWGFCLSFNEYKKLKKGKYRVFINSKIEPGNLIYSDKLIPGKSKKEILLSTYLCHPQMANHEIGGPLVWSILYKILKNTGPHNYSYRFLICPENIGAASFLYNNKKDIKKKIIAGYIINGVGHGKEYFYKRSRQGNSISDLAAINVLEHSNFKYELIDFFPSGSDERQFCSPGFNLPMGLLMRSKLDDLREYHNSLDNENFISFETLIESIKMYYEILLTIDNNFLPYAKIQYGTPQLSKSPIKLYPERMRFNKPNPLGKETEILLEILNLSDGKKNLLSIANEKKFKLLDYINLIKKLLKTKYIKKI